MYILPKTFSSFWLHYQGAVDDRAESGRLGKLGLVLLGSARFGIFVEYRAEPYDNHFQIIVATSLTKL